VARFDEGPSFGRDPGDAASGRPESLSDYPTRPPAAPGLPDADGSTPDPGRPAAGAERYAPGYPATGRDAGVSGPAYLAPGYLNSNADPSSGPGYPSSGLGYPTSDPARSSAEPGYPTSGPGYPSPDPRRASAGPGYPTPGPGSSTPSPGSSTAGSDGGASALGPGGAAGGSSTGSQAVINEPTQSLPTVKPLKVGARAVIVYQETVRRPWRLWAFTAVLVALTVGVVLGQTIAFEPTYRSGANAQAAVVPNAPSPAPSLAGSAGPSSSPAWPDAAHRATAALGAAKARVLEVVGSSAVLRVRSADLGKNLYDIGTLDRSAVPRLTTTKQGATLELIPTGDDGTVGAEIQLNSKVAWTLKLTGGLTEQSIDMQAGGVAGIQLSGGSAHTALLLPAPKGTVPLSVKGPLGDLTVTTRTKVPLRLKLTDGVNSAVVNGKPHRDVKPGTTLTPTGWKAAKNRYDLTTAGKITALLATTSPPVAASSSPSPSAPSPSPSAR
jgi:hypothetical protein